MKKVCLRTEQPWLYLWVGLVVALCWGSASFGQVVINEILVDNQNTLANTAGKYPGWIELYNTATEPVNLGSWGLTDSLSTPDKYLFPAGTAIGAKGFLLVWCDSETNLTGLHTIWTLKNTGDDVGLFNSATQRMDYVSFGLQLTDVSLGRWPDGGAVLRPGTPSPLGANGALAVASVGPGGININEWMADASTTNNAKGNDWFELYNTNAVMVDLGGLSLANTPLTTGWTNPPFPQFSFLPGNGYLRIWADKKTSPCDHANFKLSKTGDEIWLVATGPAREIDHVVFGAQTLDISQGRLPDGATNIVSFSPVGKDTPGDSNFQYVTNVVINELLAHTDPPLEDALESFNRSATPVDISYWWLSNSPNDQKKYRIPGNTVLPPGGFKVFYEYQFNPDRTGSGRNFTFNSAEGDQVYLFSASNDLSGTLLGERLYKQFEPTQNGVSLGRHVTSDGTADFVPMTRLSFGTSVTASDPPDQLSLFRTGTGAANPYPKLGPVVISEIMYHPVDTVYDNTGTTLLDNSIDEYVELCNAGTQTVHLYDDLGPYSGLYYDQNYPDIGFYADGRTNTWRVRGSINFDFPTNVSLRAGESLLVVNFDPAADSAQLGAFRSKFNVPAGTQLFGPYSHKLPNSGGSVELQKPDPPQGPAHPDFRTVPFIFIEKVQYLDQAPWPMDADGLGGSLERVSLTGYANDVTNWVAASPSPGRVAQAVQELTFTSISRTNSSLVLRFDAPAANSTFSILSATAVTGQPWTKVTDILVGANTGPQEAVVALAAGTRFFRLVTPKVP